MPPSEFDDDVELIVDLYHGWSDAVAVGRAEIEGYLAAHLYPDLPQCAPGEKTLPIYTAQSESIGRADDWAISWGPLDGVRPDGRVYEVQLEELDSPSHVAILHGVAYVFWNCKGDAATAPATDPGVWYAADPPTYFPASLPGAGDYFGSGCSPGTANLPDGIWYGHIESASSAEIEFDLVCFAPTPAGEDGVGRFTNSSSRLRTVRVAPGATVNAVALDGGWEIQPYSTWRLDPGEDGFCPPDGCWTVWLYVNNGEVTEIVQLWFA